MQRLSGLRGLEGFRSLAGSTSTAMGAANPKPASDAGGSTYGSFANLKITAEKLVKEQASVKTDLEMAHTKLRRVTEQINLLEGKLQHAVNENAKLKVNQTEDSKLWQGLDSKILSAKTLCDQLTETLTLQQLASKIEQGEEDKKVFGEKLMNSSTALAEFNCQLHDLSAKLECAEQTIVSGKQQILQIKHEKEEMDQSYKEQLCANDTTIKEKESLIKQLKGSLDENKSQLMCVNSSLQSMEQELKLKDDACISLKENLASVEKEKDNLELRNQGCSLEIAKILKVARIQQDNEHKESTLRAYHKEEPQRIQSQAENELRETENSFASESPIRKLEATLDSISREKEEMEMQLTDVLELESEISIWTAKEKEYAQADLRLSNCHDELVKIMAKASSSNLARPWPFGEGAGLPHASKAQDQLHQPLFEGHIRNTVTLELNEDPKQMLQNYQQAMAHYRLWTVLHSVELDVSSLYGSPKSTYVLSDEDTFYFVIKHGSKAATLIIDALDGWLHAAAGSKRVVQFTRKTRGPYVTLAYTVLLSGEASYDQISPLDNEGEIPLGYEALANAVDIIHDFDHLKDVKELKMAFGVLVVAVMEAGKFHETYDANCHVLATGAQSTLNEQNSNAALELTKWGKIAKRVGEHFFGLLSRKRLILKLSSLKLPGITSFNDAMDRVFVFPLSFIPPMAVDREFAVHRANARKWTWSPVDDGKGNHFPLQKLYNMLLAKVIVGDQRAEHLKFLGDHEKFFGNRLGGPSSPTAASFLRRNPWGTPTQHSHIWRGQLPVRGKTLLQAIKLSTFMKFFTRH